MDPALKCPSMLSSPLDNNTGSHYSYFALGIRAVEMAWEFAEGPFRAKVGALCEMGKFLWVQKIRTVASQRFHKKTRVHSTALYCSSMPPILHVGTSDGHFTRVCKTFRTEAH